MFGLDYANFYGLQSCNYVLEMGKAIGALLNSGSDAAAIERDVDQGRAGPANA